MESGWGLLVGTGAGVGLIVGSRFSSWAFFIRGFVLL
jgi:hypothetical protein